MCKLEVEQEMFYIHAPYNELPIIRKGVVREKPPLLKDSDGYWICPFEHKDMSGRISYEWREPHLVFLSEADAYPTLSSIINERIDRKHKEIYDLREHGQKVLRSLLSELHGEELEEDKSGVSDQNP